MPYCPSCGHRIQAAVRVCPKCHLALLRVVPQRQRQSRPPAGSPRPSRKPRSPIGPTESESLVAAAFEWLGREENKRRVLVGIALGLLLLMAAMFSAVRGGEEEYKGEMRTKLLIYYADPDGKLGLYWMDDETKAIVRKATSDEIGRCAELYPDEAVPICQTPYYEKDENEQ